MLSHAKVESEKSIVVDIMLVLFKQTKMIMPVMWILTYIHVHNPLNTVGDIKTDITMRQVFWDEYYHLGVKLRM